MLFWTHSAAFQVRRIGLFLKDITVTGAAQAGDLISDKVSRILGRDDSFVNSALAMALDAFRSTTTGMLGGEPGLTSLVFLLDKTWLLKGTLRNMGPLTKLLPIAAHVDVVLFVLVVLVKVVLVAGRPLEPNVELEDALPALLGRARTAFQPSELTRTLQRLQEGLDVLDVDAVKRREPLLAFNLASYFTALKAVFKGIGVPIADAKL